MTRLRNERKRLMEVGNELRAALNRQPPSLDKEKSYAHLPSTSSAASSSSSPSSSSSSSSHHGHHNTTTITSKVESTNSTVLPSHTARDGVHMTSRPPLNYPPALRATANSSHLGGTHYTIHPSTQSQSHHPSSSSSSSSSSSLGMEFGSGGSAGGIGILRGAGIQGQGLPTTQPIMTGTTIGTGTNTTNTTTTGGATGGGGGGGTFSRSDILPIALTNSDRTTLSQLKARQRIVEKQQSGKIETDEKQVQSISR